MTGHHHRTSCFRFFAQLPLFLLIAWALYASGCRTADAARSSTKLAPNVPRTCAEGPSQRRQSDLLGQQIAVTRSRECLRQIELSLKRVLEAPRPCDHDSIGANPYLCPRLEVEGGLLTATIEGLLSRVDVLAKEIEGRILAGSAGDANLIDVAMRLEGAIGRTESRVRLLDQDLHEGIWGWMSCPGPDGGTTPCACSPSSTCSAWTAGNPEPTCTCIPSER